MQEYYQMIEKAVGGTAYANLLFFVHAQHNHAGPDTAGIGETRVNHKYYRYMLEQMRDATLDALSSSEEAYLFFGHDQFYFGLGDARDPLMQDSTVHILRAYRNQERAGTPVVTIANWAMHPEVTLDFSPEFQEEECLKAVPPISDCSADGRFFTHDFPGHFSTQLKDLQGGGEALFFNGALGSQIGPHAPVWEVTTSAPLGNGKSVPEGAQVVPRNFRNTYLIGRSLAQFVQNIPLVNADSPLSFGNLEYRETTMMIRLTNFGFRVGLCPLGTVFPEEEDANDRPLQIGNTLRPVYVCQGENPTMKDCVSDNFACNFDEESGQPYRVGQFAETEVKYVKLGPIKIIAIPGELVPELSVGLPLDFDSPESVSKYYGPPVNHPTGKDYSVPGIIADMADCTLESPCWTLGLTQDEIGYIFPISDWQIFCTAAPEECLALYQSGALAFEDAASGSQCKSITDSPKDSQLYYESKYDADTWSILNHTCTYGQSAGAPQDHYEEVCCFYLLLSELLTLSC